MARADAPQKGEQVVTSAGCQVSMSRASTRAVADNISGATEVDQCRG